MFKPKKVYKMRDKHEKHYIDKGFLPNLPFKTLICGRSHISGKTNLCGSLILLDSFYNRNFKGDDIYIISPSIMTDDKINSIIEVKKIPDENLFEYPDEEILTALYDKLEDDFLNTKGKKKHTLFYFDDCSFGGAMKGKKHGIINKFFQNGRHINISTLACSQVYNDIDLNMRRNASAIISFNISDKDLDILCDENNYLKDRKEFKKLFRDVVNDKHKIFTICYSNNQKDMYLDSNFMPVRPNMENTEK